MTTGAVTRAKLQSNCHHQQTNIQLFTGPDALPVAQQQGHVNCPNNFSWKWFFLCTLAVEFEV